MADNDKDKQYYIYLYSSVQNKFYNVYLSSHKHWNSSYERLDHFCRVNASIFSSRDVRSSHIGNWNMCHCRFYRHGRNLPSFYRFTNNWVVFSSLNKIWDSGIRDQRKLGLWRIDLNSVWRLKYIFTWTWISIVSSESNEIKVTIKLLWVKCSVESRLKKQTKGLSGRANAAMITTGIRCTVTVTDRKYYIHPYIITVTLCQSILNFIAVDARALWNDNFNGTVRLKSRGFLWLYKGVEIMNGLDDYALQNNEEESNCNEWIRSSFELIHKKV